eukprot:CAMPEP_0194202676 /NCGR_PEP_ID=MMETSP0156-20130528/2648_1 /TAXON_ID=33649 /ORGANISM="Thalassionema nitzschioides, Strain L26-B" /LENGTH=642 /DNA_ID=CAMNT_0038928247 /DNA_START=128 /DNA_END=2056 /DNA_ORIENTATION=-
MTPSEESGDNNADDNIDIEEGNELDEADDNNEMATATELKVSEPELVVEALSSEGEAEGFSSENSLRRYEFASDDGSADHPSLEEEADQFLKGHAPVPVQAGIYPNSCSNSDKAMGEEEEDPNKMPLDRSSSREESTTDEDFAKDVSTDEDMAAAAARYPPREELTTKQQPAQAVQPQFRKMARRDSGPGSRNKWNNEQMEYFSEEERNSFQLPPVDEKVFVEKTQKLKGQPKAQQQKQQQQTKKNRPMKRRSSLGAVDTGAAEMFGELSDDAADEFLNMDDPIAGIGSHHDASYLEEAEHNLFLAVKQQRARDEAARRFCDELDVEENIPSAQSRKKKSSSSARRSRRHQSVFEQRRSGKPRVPRPRPRSSKRLDDSNVSGRSLVTIPDPPDNSARIGTFRLSNAAKVRSPDEILKKKSGVLFCGAAGRKKIMVLSCLIFGIALMVGSVVMFPDLIGEFDSKALLQSSPFFFRGTAANAAANSHNNNNKNEQILWAKLGPHPDYMGAIAPPEGEVTLVFDRFSQITASLHLPNIISRNCHWEILTGRTCADSAELGKTPFYNTSLWQHGSPYEGQTQISSIHIGYTAKETSGQAVVVYAPGPYYQVACGILEYQYTAQPSSSSKSSSSSSNVVVVTGNIKH